MGVTRERQQNASSNPTTILKIYPVAPLNPLKGMTTRKNSW